MRTRFSILLSVLTLAAPAAFAARPVLPTAATAAVRPLSQVARQVMPPLDLATLAAEDEATAGLDLPPRFAVPFEVDITPDSAGTWERVDDQTLLWRLRIVAPDALSLNLGFTRYLLPPGARLFLYSADFKHVVRPFTEDDDETHGELWTPVVPANDVVVELTIPEARLASYELVLGSINQGYKGFGVPSADKSGSCNVDVVCPQGDPWRDQIRSVGVISTGGSTFCTGFLVNDTAGDLKPYFMTANHCGINSGNAASLVVYWNFESSTCRPVGSPASGGPGDGSLAQFQTGSFFRAARSQSDFTLVELDDPPDPAFDVYWAGWDANSGDSTSATCIHHPNTDEKRITFSYVATTTTSYNNPAVPGDGTHVHAFWDPPNGLGVTEPGSSGSPLFNQDQRIVGQLHGGPSACAASDKSDYYGRFSVSWATGTTAATRLKDWLDAGDTGALAIDGRNACTPPSVPSGLGAAANGANRIDLAWSAAGGATSYSVYRALGACPQTSFTQIASGLASPAFSDTTVSGGSTYSYKVSAVDDGAACESNVSGCVDAAATGLCTLAPVFAGATAAANQAADHCGIDLAWSAASSSCGGAVVYNLYRSTTQGFVPSGGNLIAACQPGNAFTDLGVASGTTYYYVVRAEDSSGNGSGPCAGGNEDANGAERFATAAGPPVSVFSDSIEAGAAAWATSGSGGTPWSIVTSSSHSPTHAWFSDDPTSVKDQRVATSTALALPGGAPATLDFWHRFATESTWDGGVLEYSLDGASWFDILLGNGGAVPANPNRFLANGYNGGLNSSANPVAGRAAWTGSSGTFQQVRVDLSDLAGLSPRLRWRFGSDASVGSTGWWLDDVTVAYGSTCTTVSDLIFADGVESGDLGVWTSAVTDGGDLAATAGAALVGGFGIAATVDDTNPIYVQDDSPGGENRYRARFYLDPNGFTVGVDGERTKVFQVLAEPLRRLVTVVLRKQGGVFKLLAKAHLDDDSWANSGFFDLADAPHVIELDWRRATAPAAADGSLGLWIDGAPAATLSGLTNNLSTVESARLGVISVKPGAAGTLLFDAFESRRASYIGP